MAATPEPSAERGRQQPPRSLRSMWLRRGLLLVLAIACARIIIDLVGQIDWNAVKDAIGHLEAWQFVVLVAMVILRQVLNAMPLVFFIPGLSLFRATGSDQGTTLMSMVAPPTTDHVFRIAVLKSWDIDIDRAAAGATCNILVFYMMRWLSPLIGVVLLATVRFDTLYGLTAAGSFLVAAAIFVGALLVTKSQPLAQRLGRWAGRAAVRIRRSVDPEGWASSVGGFQSHIADRFRRGLALSLPVLIAKVVVDAGILVLAARFVGVSQGDLSWVEIMAAFLVAFPLTLFPLQGIGILDATIVAELTAIGGIHLEAALVAAMVIYRVVTLGVPALLGVLFIFGWRHQQRREALRAAPP